MSQHGIFGVRGTVALTGAAQDLGKVARGFYCGGSGDLVVTMEDGSTGSYVGIAAGVIHPIRFQAVVSFSGTGAEAQL